MSFWLMTTLEDFVDEQSSAGLLDLGVDEYIDQILDSIESNTHIEI